MGTDLGDLVFESPPWLKAEAEASDVVLSSRVRLARNIGNIPFPNHAKDETLEDVLIQVERVLPEVEAFSGAVFFEMATLSNTEQHILAERRLISPEFIMKAIPAGLVLGDDGLSSLMVNEEDHLRLQVLHPGLGLDQTLEKAEELDRELSVSLDFAYSEEFGYLTACPTNAGTGLRVSLFVHLPALTETNRLQEVLGAWRGGEGRYTET
jgi:protein arginine kinase